MGFGVQACLEYRKGCLQEKKSLGSSVITPLHALDVISYSFRIILRMKKLI